MDEARTIVIYHTFSEPSMIPNYLINNYYEFVNSTLAFICNVMYNGKIMIHFRIYKAFKAYVS